MVHSYCSFIVQSDKNACKCWYRCDDDNSCNHRIRIMFVLKFLCQKFLKKHPKVICLKLFCQKIFHSKVFYFNVDCAPHALPS